MAIFETKEKSEFSNFLVTRRDLTAAFSAIASLKSDACTGVIKISIIA